MTIGVKQGSRLGKCVNDEIEEYFTRINGHKIVGLYDLVISEVEAALFGSVMKYANYNQSNAAVMLGINRGTLRKKLKQYGLDKN